MNILGGIILFAFVGAGIVLASLGIRKTLSEKGGDTRKARRHH